MNDQRRLLLWVARNQVKLPENFQTTIRIVFNVYCINIYIILPAINYYKLAFANLILTTAIH